MNSHDSSKGKLPATFNKISRDSEKNNPLEKIGKNSAITPAKKTVTHQQNNKEPTKLMNKNNKMQSDQFKQPKILNKITEKPQNNSNNKPNNQVAKKNSVEMTAKDLEEFQNSMHGPIEENEYDMIDENEKIPVFPIIFKEEHPIKTLNQQRKRTQNSNITPPKTHPKKHKR